MTPILENAALGSDLDCQNLSLLNIHALYPVPDGLVDIDDQRLYDPRVPPFGSVTDDSVSPTAGIEQSKLTLNGVIPAEWMTNGVVSLSDNPAAKGDSVELVSRKGAPNGYAALDANGKLPASIVTATANPGTVNSVGLQMPPELNLPVSAPIVAGSGAFAVGWNGAPDQSWFGVHGYDLDGLAKPSFQVGRMPPGLVSSIDASKFTTGIFAVEVLPVASGVNPGVVPDPGFMGLPTDYLGRDMQWHQFGSDVPEVVTTPIVPTPLITLDSWSETEVLVTVRSTLPGSSLFIMVQKFPGYADTGFKQSKMEHHDKLFPDVHDTISVNEKDLVWAYAAKAGYQNSKFQPQPVDGSRNPWLVTTPLSIIP